MITPIIIPVRSQPAEPPKCRHCGGSDPIPDSGPVWPFFVALAAIGLGFVFCINVIYDWTLSYRPMSLVDAIVHNAMEWLDPLTRLW